MTTTSPDDLVTNTLRPLLQRQLARLRGRYAVHGLATTLLLLAALVALFYGLDRGLRLPVPIRLLHSAAVVLTTTLAFVYFVRYPMRRSFSEVDLAQWLERRFPILHERLVSSIQLGSAAPAELRNQSAAMIAELQRDAAAAVARLSLDDLFDPAPIRYRVAAAAALGGALATAAMASPETARIFALRHLGFDVTYPRATTLRVELPPAGPDLQRLDDGDTTELVLPAGADLHVSVLAEGVVPKEVVLDVRTMRDDRSPVGTREVAMTPRPGDRFRHVFRRLSGSFEFRARGGDDDQGDRLVRVRTVRPAQVATLSARSTFPAYTGQPPVESSGGAIEALVGSTIVITVTTTAAVRAATMVFLESGRRLELAATALQDDGGTASAFTGTFVLESSDRYQIELVADNDLRNPNPGTYPLLAQQDFAPVGRWLLPGEDSLALLPNALLCLRVQARDDFGLRSVRLAVTRGQELAIERELQPTPPPEAPPTRELVTTELLEVRELLTALTANEGLQLRVDLVDNRQPTPATTELPHRIVQIVDAPELAGLIAKAFRALREEVQMAHDLQVDRLARVEELLLATAASPGERAQVLTGVAVGQGRITGAIGRVHRGLMRAFDVHLWNRLEPSQHAAAVVELFRAHSRTVREPIDHDPAFYREIAARRAAGTLGAMETTLDPILAMVELADRLATAVLPGLTRGVEEAEVARDAASQRQHLEHVLTMQRQVETALQQLLLRLEEWNDYQDLVQEVRALRDRQRDLQNRTEEARSR